MIFSIVIGQPKKNEDVLKNIQKNAISINKKENMDLEKKFAQAKSLERSGLYDEAFTLFKTINQDKPGIKKFFQPIKNYLKQTEEWDTLLVYTKDYARARNHDFQSQLELLNIYIWIQDETKWKKIARELTESSDINHNSMKITLNQLINNGKYDLLKAK